MPPGMNVRSIRRTSLGLRRCVDGCLFFSDDYAWAGTMIRCAKGQAGGFMKNVEKSKCYFSKSEIILWSLSVAAVTIVFAIFDRKNFFALIASVIGITSLIFNAKGNPLGQFLILIFSVLYGIISWRQAYYGEMITYLGMTAPMSLIALVMWIKHPYKGNSAEVKVNGLRKREYLFMLLLTLAITWIFYYILRYFDTANLIVSTVSVGTSFAAVYLTARRSEYYAIGYALNDIVLVVLWSIAAAKDIGYISVAVCFGAFLVNDLYGYYNWQKMRKRQSESE